MLICKKCNMPKLNIEMLNGTTCKKCRNIQKNLYRNKWRILNKDKYNAYSQKWRLNNPDYQAFRYATDMAYREKRNTNQRLLNRTPKKWPTNHLIKDVYALAKATSEFMERSYHVDHIIPIVPRDPILGPYGLHVFENLQILLAKENLAKSNR